MKNYLFIILITSLFVSSCNPKQNKNDYKINTAFEKYNEAYKKASQSKILIDTIFLGLRFGMTEKEVNNYLSEMKFKGKLGSDDIGRYEYKLINGNNTVKSSLSAEYYQGKLYKFSLDFQEYAVNDIYIQIDKKIMVNCAKNAFLNKSAIKNERFNAFYYTLEGIGMFSCFIKNNLLVEFSPLGNMSYINIPIESQKENQEKQAKKQKSQDSMMDL